MKGGKMEQLFNLQAGALTVGVDTFNLKTCTGEELIEALGDPQEIYRLADQQDISFYIFEPLSDLAIKAFSKNDGPVLELILELAEDIFLSDLIKIYGQPRFIERNRILYALFGSNFAARILDNQLGTVDVLGFFSQAVSDPETSFFVKGTAYMTGLRFKGQEIFKKNFPLPR